MGWSTQAASLDLGTDRHSFGFGGTGKKSHNRSFDSYGEVSGGLLWVWDGHLAAPWLSGHPLPMPIVKTRPCFLTYLSASLQPYGLNDTIGCLLDCEGGSIAFTKNGTPLGPAFQLPQVGQSVGDMSVVHIG